jgi:hypothetical protein
MYTTLREIKQSFYSQEEKSYTLRERQRKKMDEFSWKCPNFRALTLRLVVVEIGSHFVAQTDLKLMIFLPQPLGFWD